MQDVLTILVADNDGRKYEVKQPVDPLTFELVMGLERENRQLVNILLVDDLETKLFGVVTRPSFV